eukprot:6461408-Amphidinium_carterae.1
MARPKGKGSKGKGKHRTHTYWADAWAFFKGKGKGKGKGSKGKGKHRENPRDQQGNIMRCHRCGSTTHFEARCPQPQAPQAQQQSHVVAGPTSGSLGAFERLGSIPPATTSTVQLASTLLAHAVPSVDTGDAPSEGNSWIVADRLTASTMTVDSAVTQQDQMATPMYAHIPDDMQQPPFPTSSFDSWHQPPWVNQATPWQPLPPAQPAAMQRLQEPWQSAPQIQSAAARGLLARSDARQQRVPSFADITTGPVSYKAAPPRPPLFRAPTRVHQVPARQTRGRRRSPANLPAAVAMERMASPVQRFPSPNVVAAVRASGPPAPIAPTPVQGIQQIMTRRQQRVIPPTEVTPQGDVTMLGAEHLEAQSVASMPNSPPMTPPPPRSQSAPPATPESLPSHFEGDDTQCSLCMEEFQGSELCCRLLCRHLFHSSCYEHYMLHHSQQFPPPQSQLPSCPNCRGSGRITATWRYVAAVQIRTPSPRSRTHSVVFHTPGTGDELPDSPTKHGVICLVAHG